MKNDEVAFRQLNKYLVGERRVIIYVHMAKKGLMGTWISSWMFCESAWTLRYKGWSANTESELLIQEVTGIIYKWQAIIFLFESH